MIDYGKQFISTLRKELIFEWQIIQNQKCPTEFDLFVNHIEAGTARRIVYDNVIGFCGVRVIPYIPKSH